VLKEQLGHKVIDLILTALAFLTAYYLKIYWLGDSPFSRENATLPFLVLAIMVCCGLSYDFFGCYELHRQQNFGRVFLRIAKSALFGAAGVILLLYLLRMSEGSQILIASFVGLDILYLTICRATILSRRKRGLHRKEILIIGSRERARELIRYVTANEEMGYHIIGCLDVDPAPVGTEVAEGITIIGTLGDFRQLLLDSAVDEVIFAIPLIKVDGVIDYIGFAEEQGVNVRVLPDWQIPELMYQPRLASVFIEPFVGIPTLALSSTPRKELALQIKTLLDRVSAFFGLVVLLPLFLAVAATIKLTSKGPVFFRQVRCGLNGRKFVLYKFRTMVHEAEKMRAGLQAANEMDGPVFKIENDPRLTAIGKFLRKSSLDELPQLINVVRGEMSLVGPRPPLPSEVAEYKHWQRRRLSMKPGLTCIWQVSGRNEVRFEDWMRMDLEYIDNWSLVLDLKLLLKTVPAVLFGTGK